MARTLWLWVITMLVQNLQINRWWCLGCLEGERRALLDIKANINHPHGTSLPLWVGYETSDCCQWAEVECNSTTGRVNRLFLDEARDQSLGNWHFNASLFLPFEELNTLSLYKTSLAGWVENNGFERLSRLSNLEDLDLSWNHLGNNILLSLSQISSLKSLSLRGNELEGSIPFTKSEDFINLKVLDLSFNYVDKFEIFQGFGVPSALGKLEFLDISNNYFTNSTLLSLTGLSRLKSLQLYSNQVYGSIDFSELDVLSNLEELDLSYNNIDSFVNPKGKESLSKLKVLHLDDMDSDANDLLNSLGLFSSLQTLYFQWNNVKGTITSQGLRNLSNLEALIMDHSSFSENFLQNIQVLTSLKVLSLADCGLNGRLPNQGWCEVNSLEDINLSGNQLEGILPPCLGNLTSLCAIDISDNQFTGNIATSPLTTLTSLKFVSFSNNQFQFSSLLSSFSNHSNLKGIFCSNNKLIEEPAIKSFTPKFQLKIFAMSSCSSNEANLALPNFLYYQNDLRIVDISHNNLNTNFPSWLLENNTRLERLYLRNNSFKGTFGLPSHPNPNIHTIDISNNNLGGHIPKNISSIFPNLEQVNMSTNFFEGNPISAFNGMNSLDVLDLSNNHLSGEIAEHSPMNCPSLTFLKLSDNNFFGQLSPKALNLTRMWDLYLDGNNFTGKIPDGLSTMPLRILDVSNNHFSGVLPRWIANLTNLLFIAMERNQFSGPIPAEFCKFGSLIFLDLSENYLNGSIPSCLFNQSDLKYVHLHNNRLEGTMKRAFRNNSALVTLDLRYNYFLGSSNWIDRFSALSVLLLKANNFAGEIPTELCHSSKLSIVDLSQNHFFGPIPSCFGNITLEANHGVYFEPDSYVTMGDVSDSFTSLMGLTEISNLGLSYTVPGIPDFPALDAQEEVWFTTKSFYYPYKGEILRFMSGIDLSCNNLTGEIPAEIGNLSKVHALNFSHNNLTGLIPATFSSLRQIESLDLSYNNLNGRIPPQLVELNYLAVFSVAYDNLSGTTPERKAQFATFEESSYEGNPHLCGPPLPRVCFETDLSPSSRPTEDGGEDYEFIDMDVFKVSFVASYVTILLGIVAVLYINPHWRKAWFYTIEMLITNCYYFVVDNLYSLHNFKTMCCRPLYKVLYVRT